MVSFRAMKQHTRSVLAAMGILGLAALVGCQAISREVNHGKLETSTKVSHAIFLPPVPPSDRRVYLQVKNTSDVNLPIANQMQRDLQTNGWTVVDDLNKAHTLMQVVVVQAGRARSMEDIDNSVNYGWGGALAGGLLGSALSGGKTGGTLAGAAAGGIAAWVANMMTKDVIYSVMTDVQISVRQNGRNDSQDWDDNDKEGANNKHHRHRAHHHNRNDDYLLDNDENGNWRRYRVRVVSYARQVNLQFPVAAPVLARDLARQIANLL